MYRSIISAALNNYLSLASKVVFFVVVVIFEDNKSRAFIKAYFLETKYPIPNTQYKLLK